MASCFSHHVLLCILAGGPAADRREAMARIEMIADTYLSVSAPVQHALPAMLEAAAGVGDQLAARVAHNLSTLRQVCGASSLLTAPPVDAGWYASLRAPAVMSAKAWAVLLVQEDGVVVHPGSLFGFEREGVLVTGLIAPPEVFEEGVRRMDRRVTAVCG